MAGKIVLFGASGYTGRKTAQALVEGGAAPLLVGRSAEKLKALATALGGPEVAVADVGDPAALQRLLGRGDTLVTTVGPFARLGDVAVQAALAQGAHYLDSTGEPVFIRRVFERADAAARAAGIVMLTAFGYDYVPGHTVAAAALQAAGPSATAVDIGYFVGDGAPFGLSQGTRASLLGVMFDPGLFYRGGRLVEDFGGTRAATFTLLGRPRDGLSVPGSEHLWLPQSFPQLREVGVYLGWFGRHTRLLQRVSRLNGVLLRVAPLRRALKAMTPQPASQGEGPSDASLARARSHIVGVARDDSGRELARAELIGVDGYTYTARMLAWGATAIASGQVGARGAVGPLGAFALPTLVAGNAAAGMELRRNGGG